MVSFIRLAELKDLPTLLEIVQQAKTFLKFQGLPQWQGDSGPNEGTLRSDIDKKIGYVFIFQGEIAGYANLTPGVDPVYTEISEGQWQTGADRYVSIHRVALSIKFRGQGLADKFLQALITVAGVNGSRDIRIDTHPRNVIMEKVILNAGFTYQGMVYFPIPNGERRAYQLILEDTK